MKMKLSIIIVNYNVCYFLDQAISSVLQSETDFTFEMLVVDNGSSDASVEMVKQKYPGVRLIETGENLGFAKANNIAARHCIGEYLLLLNPDTILKKDTLQKCIDHISSLSDAGALGVKMYDGNGNYLPESKRGFPGPWAAFFKITGLNALFPRSRVFNYYYLGHLSANENKEVDVLTGAFMMLERKKYMDLNGLDEDFFMYGEDIDLCYRLHEHGYKNHYLASSSIIHFKGESTSKHTVRYIRTFYNAMSIYARKHYAQRLYAFISIFIQLAIYGRAAVAILARRIKHAYPIFRDVIIIGLLSVAGWEVVGASVPWKSLVLLSPIVPLIWFVAGSYEGKFEWWPYVKWSSLFFIFLSITALSGFSADIWAIGSSVLILALGRILYMQYTKGAVFLPSNKQADIAALFSDSEGEQAIRKLMDLLEEAPARYSLVTTDILTEWRSGKQSLPDEIIFDPKTVQWDTIVSIILDFADQQDFRILSLDNKALITSLSKNEAASIITEKEAVQRDLKENLLYKSRCDILLSALVFLCFPYFLLRRRTSFIKHAFLVLLGRRTWVGINELSLEHDLELPQAYWNYESAVSSVESRRLAQLIYIKNYSPLRDLNYLWTKS